MFSYIASVLFQGQQNSTNIDQDHASSRPPHVSCEGYGWTIQRTDIRLQVSGTNSSVVRIFGFPPQEDYPKGMRYPPPLFGNEGPYIHYLLGESPASVKYIMGDDWRSQLQSDPRNARTDSDSHGGDVVLRPSVASNDTYSTESFPSDSEAVSAEERVHSLRMRRCGAVAICTKDDIGHQDARDGTPTYLFGWPESGGVWVVRPPWSKPESERPADHERTDEEIMEDKLKEIEADKVYVALAGEVKRQEHMEDVCRVLEEASGRFYADVGECPEAVELNLC